MELINVTAEALDHAIASVCVGRRHDETSTLEERLAVRITNSMELMEWVEMMVSATPAEGGLTSIVLTAVALGIEIGFAVANSTGRIH